jgi:hypothetical protein
MRPRLVELNMNEEEGAGGIQTREKKHSELEVQNMRLAEALRKAEFRIAIEASTARILGLALTRNPMDTDPEAA